MQPRYHSLRTPHGPPPPYSLPPPQQSTSPPNSFERRRSSLRSDSIPGVPDTGDSAASQLSVPTWPSSSPLLDNPNSSPTLDAGGEGATAATGSTSSGIASSYRNWTEPREPPSAFPHGRNVFSWLPHHSPEPLDSGSLPGLVSDNLDAAYHSSSTGRKYAAAATLYLMELQRSTRPGPVWTDTYVGPSGSVSLRLTPVKAVPSQDEIYTPRLDRMSSLKQRIALYHELTQPRETTSRKHLIDLWDKMTGEFKQTVLSMTDESQSEPWSLQTTEPTDAAEVGLNPECTDTTPLKLSGLTDHGADIITAVCGLDPGASPLFRVGTDRHRGCMRAQFTIGPGSNDGETLPAYSVRVGGVVDSGAAWTAMRTDLAKKVFGSALRLTAPDFRFHGASGEQLQCQGWVTISLRVGDEPFSTRAYVFDNLSEALLLGSNTIVSQGLVVDGCNMALYPGKKVALPKGSIPLHAGSANPWPCEQLLQTSDTSERVNLSTTNGDPSSRHQGAVRWYRNRERTTLYCVRPGTNEVLAQVPGQPVRRPCHGTPPRSRRTQAQYQMRDGPSNLQGEELRRHLESLLEVQERWRPRGGSYHSAVRVASELTIPPGATETVYLVYDKYCPGVNTSLEVTLSPEFEAAQTAITAPADPISGFPTTNPSALHQSRNAMAFVRLTNHSVEPLHLATSSPIGSATLFRGIDCESLAFENDEVPDYVDSNLLPDESEDSQVTSVEFDGTIPSVQRFEVKAPSDYHRLGVDEGGSAKSIEDLQSLGLDLSLARDLDLPDAPLLTAKKDPTDYRHLVKTCLDGELVWSRNAKAPTAALHPLTRVSVDTGDAPPVRQRPYPIPHKYLEAVRAEVANLVKNGMVEPGYSDWCSPVICIIKKDTAKGAVGTDIKLKVAVDYRKLNAATIVDSGLLGDQGDVLETFRGKPYVSLCDAAGGFYQFAIKPEDRKKTCFVLPSACGGTTFVWKVAPYGLTNMPAIYSRAIMHFTNGLYQRDLGVAQTDQGLTDWPARSLGYGSVNTWVDDFTLASGGAARNLGVKGHCALLHLVFQRLIQAGITLKPSKCHILRDHLEVLGYLITRDGIKPQPDKVAAIKDMPTMLTNQKAVYRFLGMINFNRRFIYRIGDKSAPLHALLRKEVTQLPVWPWTPACQQAYDSLRASLTDNCLQSHPDLHDPLAEYVIMTDASEVAAGAVLMQWQRDLQYNDQDRPDEPLADPHDSFRAQHAARREAGYKLVTLGYFSKTFADAQKNWAIFDKEAASVVLSISHWHRLVAGRPVTVYTDNTVAASILTNHAQQRPPRLVRWGIMLGTYLPNLRIAYRKGVDNLVADHLSRYQTDGAHTCPDADFPPDLFSRLDPLVEFDGRRFALYEAVDPPAIDNIWNAKVDLDEETIALTSVSPSDVPPRPTHVPIVNRASVVSDAPPLPPPNPEVDEMIHLLARQELADDLQFATERRVAQMEFDHWEQYVGIFRAFYGRDPVVYDLFCGEGGYSRGAAAAGCYVVGIDHLDRPLVYGTSPQPRINGHSHFVRTPISSMTYVQADIFDPGFQDQLLRDGHIGGHPPPDIIHASPPCVLSTNLRGLSGQAVNRCDEMIVATVRFLQLYHATRKAGKCSGAPPTYVPWTVENVRGAAAALNSDESPSPLLTLCGTMFGHRVFRHRLIRSDSEIVIGLSCQHNGKTLGRRSLMESSARDEESNMFGAYSWQSTRRGSVEEITKAMGFTPGTFSYHGLKDALPLGYGRFLAARCTATYLLHNATVPVHSRAELMSDPQALLHLRHLEKEGVSLPQTFHRSRREVCFLLPAIPDTDCSALPSGGEGDSALPSHNETEPGPAGRKARPTLEPPSPSSHTACDAPSDPMPWKISLADQLMDPRLLTIHESVTATASSCETWPTQRRLLAQRHRRQYTLSAGVLCHVSVWGYLIMVPHQRRFELLHVFHTKLDHGGHRGGGSLYRSLQKLFWWDGMYTDAMEFVHHCEVCEGRRLAALRPTQATALPEPPFPFHTLHLDHKTLCPSGGFEYLLIVVDRLTRFCFAKPQADLSAATTLRTLLTIFHVFGFPMRIYTDNGSAFSGLLGEFARYAGLRHIFVLPYSPQANGPAEATVKRIGDLLSKHARAHKNWHLVIQWVPFALNCHVHTLSGVSPYFAVFGRQPLTVPDLEVLPHLRLDYDGSSFVTSLSDRLRNAWDSVCDYSQQLKHDAIVRNSKNRIHWNGAGPDGSLGIQVGDRVLLRHGDPLRASQRKRHGYPALRTFRVVRLIPERNAVEIDPANTTIRKEVALRHCLRAPQCYWVTDDNSLGAGRQEELGTSMRAVAASPQESGGMLPFEDDNHDSALRPEWVVDCVIDALRSKGKWWYQCSFVGYPDLCWIHEKHMNTRDSSELDDDMAAAREHYQLQIQQRRANSSTKASLPTSPHQSDSSSASDSSDEMASGETQSESIPTRDDGRPVMARMVKLGKSDAEAWLYMVVQPRSDGSLRELWKTKEQLGQGCDEEWLAKLRVTAALQPVTLLTCSLLTAVNSTGYDASHAEHAV